MKTLSEKCNAMECCQYHQDHRHRTEDYHALKNLILKLIDEGHLKEVIAQHQQMVHQQPLGQGQFSFLDNLHRST